MLRTIVAVLILLCSSVPAWAVPITGGSIGAGQINDFVAQYSLTGPNVSLDCLNFRLCGFLLPNDFNSVARPLGTPVSLDSRFMIEQFATSAGQTNRLVLDGTTYSARGTFDFTVGQVLRAPTVTAPFTFAGSLDLLHPQTFTDLGDVTLTGRGTATAFFNNTGVGTGIVFDFTSSPGNGGGVGVIPEPSTVLLLASGLAGLGLWRRRSGTP